MAIGQPDAESGYALRPQPVRQGLRGQLSAPIVVGVQGQIDGSPAVAELAELACVEMVSHRAGNVLKAGLPQHGVIEQALDENQFRAPPDLLPRIQSALGAWQKTVGRRRGRKAAPLQIAFQRKYDAMPVGVVARASDQTGLPQNRRRVAQLCQPASQATARRVADPHVLNQFR